MNFFFPLLCVVDTFFVPCVAKLVERVAKEENISIDQAENHSRCTEVRYHGALRDVQKRCRILGYGDGSKSNTVTSQILKSAGQSKTSA